MENILLIEGARTVNYLKNIQFISCNRAHKDILYSLDLHLNTIHAVYLINTHTNENNPAALRVCNAFFAKAYDVIFSERQKILQKADKNLKHR